MTVLSDSSLIATIAVRILLKSCAMPPASVPERLEFLVLAQLGLQRRLAQFGATLLADVLQHGQDATEPAEHDHLGIAVHEHLPSASCPESEHHTPHKTIALQAGHMRRPMADSIAQTRAKSVRWLRPGYNR